MRSDIQAESYCLIVETDGRYLLDLTGKEAIIARLYLAL